MVLGDCLEKIKEIETNSVQTVWTDPPYNINYVYDLYKDQRDDYFQWCKRWIVECFRVLKEDGSIFIKMWYANMPKICQILEEIGFKQRNIIIWKRHSQAGYLDRFLGGYETIIFYTKSDKNKFYPDRILKKGRFTSRWDGKKEYKGRLHDIWFDIKPITAGSLKHREGFYVGRTGKKVHPAQHPEELVKRCIICTTDEDDLVLDLFLGSGTTAMCCKRFQRKFIGFEISQNYLNLTNERLKQMTIKECFVHN